MYYFAYSTTLNQKQMQKICPESKTIFSAVLPNYRMIFLGWAREWKGATASIRAFRGEKVRGAVYEVTEKCLSQLDKADASYTRLNVTVFNEDNEPVEAITHVKGGQIRVEEGVPSQDYLALIKQGYKDWRIQ
jgi:gamma-glutamylcyclotransferase (GGCT)/AIG2-like uncharacterized protein YtfP